MKLANCIEHPRVVDPTLPCWALRHDNLRRVTPEEAMAEILRLRAALITYLTDDECAGTPDGSPDQGYTPHPIDCRFCKGLEALGDGAKAFLETART